MWGVGLVGSRVSRQAFACGSCILYPSLASPLTVIATGVIDASGQHSVSLVLPLTTIGANLTMQWLTFSPSPVNVCPSFPAISLSNAREVLFLSPL